MVLRQEGWHYEIESPDDPLTYKGVVYNEMKVLHPGQHQYRPPLARRTLVSFLDALYTICQPRCIVPAIR